MTKSSQENSCNHWNNPTFWDETSECLDPFCMQIRGHGRMEACQKTSVETMYSSALLSNEKIESKH